MIGSTPCFPTLAAGRDFVYGFCGNYFLRIDPKTLHVRSYGPFKTNFYGMVVGPDGIVYFAVGFPNVLGVFDPRRGVIQYDYTPNGDGIGAVVIGPTGTCGA